MTVQELNRDQLVEIKQSMLLERMDAEGDWPSWGEMADADSLISDEDVFEEYANTEFTEDDFFCSCEQSMAI
jgi:hypothetical protein|uniref:Uncharacterized protein n=1 Tax=Siphoviridae sp. ctAUQ2 TaxID=2826182 RepID=A0A8S5MZB0_9CAUD|nr:MAG TPA: hypothetical protein [Siphoviridae sp. ctAUQ2]